MICSCVGVPQHGGPDKAVSRHKAVKFAWHSWGIAFTTWIEYGGSPEKAATEKVATMLWHTSALLLFFSH